MNTKQQKVGQLELVAQVRNLRIQVKTLSKPFTFLAEESKEERKEENEKRKSYFLLDFTSIVGASPSAPGHNLFL